MNERMRISLFSVGVIGLLVVAGCSSSSTTSSPTAAATASSAVESASASASEAVTDSSSAATTSSPEDTASPDESASPEDSSSPDASLSMPGFDKHDDPALEAQLPDSIAGVTLTKASFTGASFLATAAGSSKLFTDFLGQLGKSPSDVSLAMAVDPTGQSGMGIEATRIAGADQNQLQTLFVNSTKQNQANAQVSSATIGGKSVIKIVDPSGLGNQYVYAKGDTLFFVQAKDDDAAAAGLSLLP